MKATSKRLTVLAGAVLLFHAVDARAGLIELIETNSGGQLTLSIEGNALRLTDNAGGSGILRVFNAPGFGTTAADDMGFIGDWPSLTVLGVPLQEAVLLPSTHLTSLLDGEGISTSGNIFHEINIIDSLGHVYSFDIDSVEVIGGPVPEPSTIFLVTFGSIFLLRWRGLAV